MSKSALITGSAKRIGKGIALRLAALGYNIALNYHASQRQAEETKKEIEKAGVKCELFKCDLSNETDISSIIDNVKSFFPDLNVLINNASFFYESSIIETKMELFNKILNINFKAPFFLTKNFARIIKKGNIINILDAKISEKNVKYTLYNLSKKILEDFTISAAKELSPDIRVNAVSPGLILAPDNENADYFDNMLKKRSIHKKGEIADINNAVEFLLKNQYITGQILYIDGGLHI